MEMLMFLNPICTEKHFLKKCCDNEVACCHRGKKTKKLTFKILKPSKHRILDVLNHVRLTISTQLS